MKIYIDGVFYPKEEAKVSVFDHCLLYGDGIFEGIRVYNGRVFRMEEHMERLWESAACINLKIPASQDEMKEIIAGTCRENGIADGYVRLLVTRGAGDLGLNPQKCPVASVICIAAQIQLYPAEFVEKGLRVITAATRRNYGEVLAPQIKSCNYLPNIMGVIEANNAGAQEAIFMTREGYVAECTADNIFVVKKGTLKTPHHGAGILRGITRGVVLELAERLAIPAEETFLNRWDLYTADEMFITGSAAELVPISEIDSRVIGGMGPITRRLGEAFTEEAQTTGYPIGI